MQLVCSNSRPRLGQPNRIDKLRHSNCFGEPSPSQVHVISRALAGPVLQLAACSSRCVGSRRLMSRETAKTFGDFEVSNSLRYHYARITLPALREAHNSTLGQTGKYMTLITRIRFSKIVTFPWRECGSVLPSISSSAQIPGMPKLRMSKLPVGSRDSLATMSSSGKEQHG